jgi:hypothetical protein
LPGSATRTHNRAGHFQQRQLGDEWRRRWREAVERAGRSSRCRGLAGDWSLTIDAFLRHEDMLVRILEGEFDDKPSTAKNVGKPGLRDTIMALGKKQ